MSETTWEEQSAKWHADRAREKALNEAVNLIAEACSGLPEGWVMSIEFRSDECSLSITTPEGDDLSEHVYPESCAVLEAIEFAREWPLQV